MVPRTGGTALGGSYNAAAAAMAAVAQASALTGPRVVRCDVCNATFAGDADMQQHLQARALFLLHLAPTVSHLYVNPACGCEATVAGKQSTTRNMDLQQPER